MNEKFTKLSFEHDVALIRLRTMILRCLGASIDVCLSSTHSSTNGQENKSSDQVNADDLDNGVDKSVSKHLDTFNNVIEELRQTYKSFLENPPERIPDVSSLARVPKNLSRFPPLTFTRVEFSGRIQRRRMFSIIFIRKIVVLFANYHRRDDARLRIL